MIHMIHQESGLYDRFVRKHDYLRVSLTERCNLRCRYCMPENGIQLTPPDHLPTSDELYEIVSAFVELGVRKIRFTGGEPLVRKDAAGIIERIAQFDTELAITTNGILLHKFFDLFEEIGMRSLNISLDTLNPKRFQQITRRDRFDRVVSNIYNSLELGFHTKINVVVLKGQNDDEIRDFIRWTYEHPVHVRFIEFMPFQGNGWDRSRLVSYFEILEQVEKSFSVQKLHDKPNSTGKSYRADGAVGTFSIISSMTAPFCATCNRLRLTADGKMRNCLFSTEEADLLNPLRNGEDIRSLILKCVQDKKKAHAGMDVLPNQPNRSMIAIGG